MASEMRRGKPSSTREVISLHVTADQKDLIDRAARRLGKSRTEFMLDSAREAAEHTLLDQRLFHLDEDQYREFIARLDAPAKPSDALMKTLAAPAPWGE